MTTQVGKLTCDKVIQKIIAGESLDDAEKSHLADCEHCMFQIVATLDTTSANKIHGEANGAIINARPEATRALERGRLVFEREFGIRLSKE
jgi:hypothetical protein